MKPDSQRIAIAEACGWKVSFNGKRCIGPLDNPNLRTLFDPIDDLNAMHEAEKTMGFNVLGGHELITEYFVNLLSVVGGNEKGTWCACICATAAQRAEAFLRTIGKWEES